MSVPKASRCKLLKGQHEFIEDMRTLASDMCTSLKAMANASPAMKLANSKESVVKLLEVIVQGARYVNDFLNKGGASEISCVYCEFMTVPKLLKIVLQLPNSGMS